jgi:hypothetical protein
VVLAYALRGGSYDLVARQEYGLLAWWVLAGGVAVGLLPRTRPSRPALVLLGAFGAYAGWTALSLLWTDSAADTFAELARVISYAGLVALVACAVDRHSWRTAVAGLGFGALVVCALAVASRLEPSWLPAGAVARTFHTDRLSYPFGYWNAVGTWGAMSIAFGLAWSAEDHSRLRRALVLALVPVASLATYLTYSRTAVAAVALALIATLVLTRHRLTALVHALAATTGSALVILAVRSAPAIAHARGNAGAGSVLGALLVAMVLGAVVALFTPILRIDRLRAPRRLVRPLLGVGCVCLLSGAAVLGPHVASRAWHSFRDTATSSAGGPARLTTLSGTRYNLWKVALDDGFLAHPATGTGAGTYEFLWNQHELDPEFVRNAHSIWFENMAELGAPGLALMLAVIGSALALAVVALRRARRPQTAGAGAAVLAMLLVYVLSASVDWMWQSTAVTVLALGAVGALNGRLGGSAAPARWHPRSAFVLVALAAAAIQVPGLLSTAAIHRSQAAARAGEERVALALARDAVSAEPWSADAHAQEGLVLESERRLAPAAGEIEAAISHERQNFALWLVLARIQTERGLYAQALRDAQRAHRLRPIAAPVG